VSLEVISTSATLLTAVVIGATAVAALIQLRHLRTGNDIAAMLNYGATFRSEQFGHAQRLVVHRLGPAMNDPAFREYVASFVRDPSPREVEQDYEDVRLAAVQIGNLDEELAILVKAGIVDKSLFIDRYSGVIAGMWRRLADFIAFTRAISDDPAIWENFEYITVLAQDWNKTHPSLYPHRVRHLEVRNRWPIVVPRTWGTVTDGRLDSTVTISER